MYIHINDSKAAKKFLADHGLKIGKDSAHNAVYLEGKVTGERLVMWAESDSNIAAGIPGIFIDE